LETDLPIHKPDCAMLLAAGLGTRMRPLTLDMPKPLVEVGGRTLMDRALDALEKTDVKRVVINLHHLGEQIQRHCQSQQASRPFQFVFSDEHAQLLDSGGGIVKALDFLGNKPFFILNADTFWQEGDISNLERLMLSFDTDKMDILLLTVRRNQAALPPERGDFLMDKDSRLCRARADDPNAVIYSGAMITHPALFKGQKATPHSLNFYFDRAIAAGRLYGLPLHGHWFTVGTMAAISLAETLIYAGS